MWNIDWISFLLGTCVGGLIYLLILLAIKIAYVISEREK